MVDPRHPLRRAGTTTAWLFPESVGAECGARQFGFQGCGKCLAHLPDGPLDDAPAAGEGMPGEVVRDSFW